MPILICVAMAGVFYLALNKIIDSKETESKGDIKNSSVCGKCHREINAHWRYCPFCGNDEHLGDNNE